MTWLFVGSFRAGRFGEKRTKKKQADEEERESDGGNLDAGEDSKNYLRHWSETCVHEPYTREN